MPVRKREHKGKGRREHKGIKEREAIEEFRRVSYIHTYYIYGKKYYMYTGKNIYMYRGKKSFSSEHSL